MWSGVVRMIAEKKTHYGLEAGGEVEPKVSLFAGGSSPT